jgi:hypothetical protein
VYGWKHRCVPVATIIANNKEFIVSPVVVEDLRERSEMCVSFCVYSKRISYKWQCLERIHRRTFSKTLSVSKLNGKHNEIDDWNK